MKRRWLATLYASISVTSALLAWWLLPGRPASEPARALAVTSGVVATQVTAPSASRALVDAGVVEELAPVASDQCPSGMLYVRGAYCARFRRCEQPQCSQGCAATPQEMSFCIDEFEYPSLPGVKPARMIAFRQAARACRVEGKRLCTDAEWTFACAGPTATPEAPVGCNTASSAIRPTGAAILAAEGEMDELQPNIANGATSCRGVFGAAHMLGNVQEWVESDQGFPAAMKGGHALTRDASCFTSTNIRDANSRTLQTGFRCCADVELRSPRSTL